MSVAIPLLALAAIALVLFVAWPRKARNAAQPRRQKTVPWEGRVRSPEEADRVAIELRDQLDRAPFGAELAHAVWQAVMRCPPNEGAILQFHRDYCGHGLIRTSAGIMLAEVQDGGMYFGPPILEWTDAADFVVFLARQSDYSCSGWDPAEPAFCTDDDWARNNQRLTRAGLERFLSTRQPHGG